MRVVKERDGRVVRRVRLVDGEGEPVGPVCRFLAHLGDRNFSPNTLCAYCYDLKYLFTFLEREGLNWQEFRPPHALQLLAFLRRVPSRRPAQRLGLAVVADARQGPATLLSPATVDRILAAVGSFYDWAIVAEEYEHDTSPIQMRPDPALARVPGRHQPFMGRASRQQPVQRAALLLVRWNGARRGEISRLALDCLDAYPDGYPRLRIPVGKTYTERMIPLHPQAADALRNLIDHARTVAAAARYDTWAHQSVRWVFMHRGQPLGKNYLFDEPLEIACRKAGLIDADGRPTVSAHRFRHTVGTQLAEGGAQIQTIMAILGHRSATMSATYSHISDPVLKEQYEKVIAAGGRVAGPAAEALLANQLGQDTLDWLKTNFFKTELELGHCLRTPAEGPCECDLYLRCSKFLTTSEYTPRLQARLARERQLIQDAVERGWPREAERHTAVSGRICDLLTELGEAPEPREGDS